MARAPGDTDFTNVNVVTAIKVGGTQVVTTQQSAVARIGTDSATDFANSAANTLNSIITALEAHGLIAT